MEIGIVIDVIFVVIVMVLLVRKIWCIYGMLDVNDLIVLKG